MIRKTERNVTRNVRGKSALLAMTTAMMVSLATMPTAAANPGGANPGGANSGGASPGSAGIGDPYYPTLGNGGYDVSHYDIRLKYQPTTDVLTGTTTIRAKATQELSQFNLDFLLKVRSVRVNDAAAGFSSAGGELVVKPRVALRAGEEARIVVEYEDIPSNVESPIAWIKAWRRTAGGALTHGEPFSSEWWYPSNNHPMDKATYSVSADVPAGFQALSNGVLRSTVKQPDGWVRWNWRSGRPQIGYATFIAMGRYQLAQSKTPAGLPIINAYANDLTNDANARAVLDRTPEIVDFFAGKLGPYPFEAMGGVVAVGPFGLEHQTRPVYGDNKFVTTGAGTYLLAHEMFHQWFGDSVAIAGWRDLWLNEGFAQYAEYLWSEHTGQGTAQDLVDALYQKYPADDPFWQSLPGDPGPGSKTQFSAAVYVRGAMAVHALRKAVGDDTFYRILRNWATQRKDGNGNTAQFIELAEHSSGKSLRALFDKWLFTKGKPTGGVTVRAGASTVAPKSLPDILRATQSLVDDHRG